MSRREVLFLTGTRADFGKLKPLIQAVHDAPEFSYRVFATGMHMLARYGSTILEIERAGFGPIYPFLNQDGTSATPMDLVLANTVQGLGHYVRAQPPALLVVHGDRAETLAGAIVGALNGILVAHVEGGEVSGTVDELMRHAVSKLSHLHFVANEEARGRLLQMGERTDAVFSIGSPDIDVMLSEELPELAEVRQRYEIPFERYGLLLYHPVSTELESQDRRARAVVAGVRQSGLPFVVIAPNNDTGTELVQARLAELQGDPGFRLLPSMRFEYFLTLLRHARAIVGNSSAGIREAPVYGTPTVNVGTRQQSRFRWETIVDVPEDAGAVATAIRHLPARGRTSLHFGDGRSARRFLEVLRQPEPWEIPRQKTFRDVALASATPGMGA